MAATVIRAHELLEFVPSDVCHLLWEEMKRIFYEIDEVKPEDLDAETMNDFLAVVESVSNIFVRI